MRALERVTSEARDLGKVETVQVSIHVVSDCCAMMDADDEPTDPKRSTSQLTASAERPFGWGTPSSGPVPIVEGSGVMLTSQDLDEIVTRELASLREKRQRQLVSIRRPRQTEGARLADFLVSAKKAATESLIPSVC